MVRPSCGLCRFRGFPCHYDESESEPALSTEFVNGENDSQSMRSGNDEVHRDGEDDDVQSMGEGEEEGGEEEEEEPCQPSDPGNGHHPLSAAGGQVSTQEVSEQTEPTLPEVSSFDTTESNQS